MLSKIKKNEKGFTLMEMLIVVAIIAVLVAIAIPTFTSSLNKAKTATDAANIRAGNGVHAGSYALGPKYTPDYKALKALWDDCTDEERQSLSHDFNDWLQAMRDQYKELCEIWTDEHKSLNLRCRLMVELVTPDENE